VNSKKIILNEITDEESAQFSGMMNWASTDDKINRMEVQTFKQYNKATKEYTVIYRIGSQDWYKDNWLLIEGEGRTLTEAMKNYTKRRGEKRGSSI